MVQLVMVTFSQGWGWAREVFFLAGLDGDAVVADIDVAFRRCGPMEQESMSMPSVLGESGGLMMERRARVTLSQATGTAAHARSC